MDRLTYRDSNGRALLNNKGMKTYCSTQATADILCKYEELLLKEVANDREILKTTLENFIESWINLAKESTDTVLETFMDKSLINGARQLFETVRQCYCEANKDYLDKQIKIASEYLTDKQKEELRQKGILN